jgi:hypothetical protein
MKTLWLRLKFGVLRKLNDNDPSRQEVEWALSVYGGHTYRIADVMSSYFIGMDFESIAKPMGVPRERVRQMICKGVRQSWWYWNEN